ncbi:hypothetical protein [Marinobacterium litorale]|uniref:hypothetical protein n=1 Tax=Marinobacterium litorale TaxID=404770 RepID=UPI0012EBE6F2|nr:hypothetical protein [Marinobacterium litorale]
MSSTRATRLPLAYVQIRSEVLTLAPLADILGSLNLAAEVLGGKVVQPKVSRVDLCVDFVTDYDLEALPRDHWITRAVGYARYYDRSRFSGLVFGQGGPISCRLYDKTLEIQKSQKTYLYELWKAQGWDGSSPVWRLEFQLKSQVLREVLIKSVPTLIERLNALWGYCTTAWLKLCEPDGGANQSRWPLAPLWDDLSRAQFNEVPAIQLRRIRKDMSPSDQSLFVNGLGALTSFMAREGIGSIQEALPLYLEAATDYHRRNSRLTGKALAGYVREKVEQKRTRFNTRTVPEFDKKSRGLK